MAGHRSPFSRQIAVALSGIVWCGPGAEAQRIMPCYRPTMATVETGQTFNGKVCRGEWGCACAVMFCPVCNSAPGAWPASCSLTTCKDLPAPKK
jgi:hypothetical protein